MAYDCRYQMTLSIMHEDASVDELTRRLSALRCIRSTQRGAVNVKTGRAASCSVWVAALTEKEWENSEENAIADSLDKVLPQLEEYQSVFAELSEKGDADIDIVMFADSNHSVAILPPAVLQGIGKTNLGLTMQWYAQDVKKSHDEG